MMNGKSRLYELILNRARIEGTERIDSTMRLEADLGYDSLSLIQLLLEIEEIFELEIDDADLIDIETVANLEAICFSE